MSYSTEFHATRLIPVPVETIWSITGEPSRNVEWVNNVREVFGHQGEGLVGDRFSERSVVVGPWTSITEWTVVGVTDHEERTFVGSGFPGVGEVRPFIRCEVFTDGSGTPHTRVTYGAHMIFTAGPLSRLLARALSSMITTEFDNSLVNLERLAVREHAASTLQTATGKDIA